MAFPWSLARTGPRAKIAICPASIESELVDFPVDTPRYAGWVNDFAGLLARSTVVRLRRKSRGALKPLKSAQMRVNEDMLKTVVFICSRNPRTGHFLLHGTGIVAAHAHDGWAQQYLITAHHVISDARNGTRASPSDGHVYARVNMKRGGAETFQLLDDSWLPGRGEADIAAIPFDWPDGAESGTVSSATFCRPENMVNHLLGVGDDVFAMGLFLDHQNRHDELRQPRNRPIMRSGMIAAMPDDLSPGQHILVELRSTGGLSGSPLWVTFGPARNDTGLPSQTMISYLLGIVRGHWREQTSGADGSAHTHWADSTNELNRGVATVVPIIHALPLLQSDEAVRQRRARAAQSVAEWRARGD